MSDEDDLRDEVCRLREEVDALHRRLDSIEAAEQPPDEGPPADTRTPPDDDAPPDAEPSADSRKQAVEAAEGGTTSEPTSEKSSRDWELRVGVRWLGVAGAVALVVGVVFFVRLAIELGWLGYLGRVAAGVVGGGVLFFGGRYAAETQGYDRWGTIAAGAGVAAAYFSLYAAYGLEAYREAIGTPLWATIAGLTVLVAAVAAVSVHDGRPAIGGEAFLLGYLTAAIGTEAVTVVLTPVYLLFVTACLVTVSAVRPWRRTAVAGVVACHVAAWAWVIEAVPPSWMVVTVGAAVFLLYLAVGTLLRRPVVPVLGSAWLTLAALTVGNAVLAALLLDAALSELTVPGSIDVGGAGAVTVAGALVGFYILTDRTPLRRDRAAALVAIPLFAVGAGQLAGTFGATAAALVVVCAGVWLSVVEDEPAFRFGSHLLAAGLVVKLLVVDATELQPGDIGDIVGSLTGRPAAFAAAVGGFYLLAWTLSRLDLHSAERNERVTVAGGYAVAATALAVIGMALELSGVGVSVAWTLFAFALLAVGFVAAVRGVRLLGIAVFALATVKVFLYDTRDLDALPRTLSFLALGVVLLAASYVYARSQDIDIGVAD